MNKLYQIDREHQIKSISNGLKVLLWFPVALLVGYLLGITSQILDPDFIAILLIYNSVLFLPALILHTTYYFANRDIKLETDTGTRSITIINSKGKHHLLPEDIKKVERVIFNDYKHPKKHQNWFPMPWRNYGYLRLITKDDRVFLLTSLLLDPLNPPIQLTKTIYSYITLLDDEIEEEAIKKELEEQFLEVTEAYKTKFQNHSEEELKKKTVSNGFRKEAVIAASELLQERITLANKN
jgi:hypothetical protein